MEVDVDKFFERCIDGYLLSDLENMKKLDPLPTTGAGAAGYPMLMTMMAGMELLGTLVQTTELSPNKANGSIKTGESQFLEYWNCYLAPTNAQYNNKGSATYQLARHGLAHSSMAKGGVVVTKQGGDPDYHMKIDKTSIQNSDVYFLTINVIQLLEDFKKSYKVFTEQRLVEPLKQATEDRLNQILNSDIAMANGLLAPLYRLPSTIQASSPTTTSSSSNIANKRGSITSLRPAIPSEGDFDI